MNAAQLYRPVSALDFTAAVQMLPAGVVALMSTGSTTIVSAWHVGCADQVTILRLSESIGSRMSIPVVFPNSEEMGKLLRSDMANPRCARCGCVIR